MSHKGKDYVKLAKKNGLDVRNGKGDHVKIYGPAGRGYMTVPVVGELDRGTESNIKKWFRALGILLVVLPPIICVVTGMLRG